MTLIHDSCIEHNDVSRILKNSGMFFAHTDGCLRSFSKKLRVSSFVRKRYFKSEMNILNSVLTLPKLAANTSLQSQRIVQVL